MRNSGSGRSGKVQGVLALGLTACLAAACASKPPPRAAAPAPTATATATTYNVGATGVALSAAAADPRGLAQVQREQGVGVSRAPAVQARRGTGPERAAAAPARTSRAAAGQAAPAPSTQATAATAETPAFQRVANLQSLTVPAGRAARALVRAPRSEAATAGDRTADAVHPGLRLALYILAGLALLGVIVSGGGWLMAGRRARKASARTPDALRAPAAANDVEPHGRPAVRRARLDPPPPRVTILAR